MQQGDFKKAARVAELEYDLFAYMGGRSWFSYLVGLINACRLPGHYCRPPLPDCGEEEYAGLEKFTCDIRVKHKNLMAEL